MNCLLLASLYLYNVDTKNNDQRMIAKKKETAQYVLSIWFLPWQCWRLHSCSLVEYWLNWGVIDMEYFEIGLWHSDLQYFPGRQHILLSFFWKHKPEKEWWKMMDFVWKIHLLDYKFVVCDSNTSTVIHLVLDSLFYAS